MSTRRTLEEQIEQAQKELKQKEARIKELLGRQRSRADKDRTRRLCERGGYLERILPETITLEAEQFNTFLDKTLLTDFARRILNGLAAQNTEVAEPPVPQASATSGANGNANAGSGASRSS